MLARALAFAVALWVVLLARTAAAAEGDPRVVDLYTIGPGDYLYARYGHSLLCARAASADPEAKAGRCYDYGVPDSESTSHMAWTAIRGQPSFIPVAIDEQVVLDVFRGQGRAIERQRLPLSQAEAARLVERMEKDVRERAAYAYHPYFANCTTMLRDRIDEATSGKLHPGRGDAGGPKFRELAEDGLSGRLGALTMLALVLGPANDRTPTGWEAMFLPSTLRDAVTERFGAPPRKLEERKAVVLPTSRAVGRVALFVLAIVLYATVRFFARRGKTRRGLFVAGIVLGGLGCITALVAAIVVWPEMTRNWALLLVLPTDLALPFLGRRSLVLYGRARIAIAAALGALEIVGVIAQPLLPLVALVVLPFVAILGTARAADPAPGQRPEGELARA